MSVLPDGASDDLADARYEDVHGSDRLPVLVELHVEGLDSLRVVRADQRPLEYHLCVRARAGVRACVCTCMCGRAREHVRD